MANTREEKQRGPRLPTDAIRKQNEMDVLNSYRGEGGTLFGKKSSRPTSSQMNRRFSTRINASRSQQLHTRTAPKRPSVPK